MPHEPGHKYQIYGSSLEYTGKVVKVGEDLFTTNGGGFEGTSQKVTEVQMNDNTQTITTTTQQAMDPLNQTNLKATKGQFRFRNGGPVPQGFAYHLHEGQAMEGATHSDIAAGTTGHRFLDRVNENSTQRMTRANVNTSRVTPTTTTRSGGGGTTGGGGMSRSGGGGY